MSGRERQRDSEREKTKTRRTGSGCYRQREAETVREHMSEEDVCYKGEAGAMLRRLGSRVKSVYDA